LINGIGRITNTSQPSYITVSLPIQVFTYIIKQSTGSYMVIDSDYKTYSLVYSCSQVTKRLKTETVWILSRGKTLNSMVINYLYAELISLGINPSHFETVTQTCNN
jgi:lipocalin